VSGTVTVNGTPVSWGSIVFTPEDPSLAVACARVMHGKFKLDAAKGPVTGRLRLTVSHSAADVPGLQTADGTATVSEASPGAGPWIVELREGDNVLDLQLKR
jgi:hypothetical protein